MERKWLILTAVSVGSLMSTLDGSIVNIALPALQQDFGVDLTTVQWVTVAYLLMIGSLLLPMGRLGEVLTFKRVYLGGFGLFTVASVLCALAPGVAALIGFRVLQAVGAAAITAIGPAIIARTFPGPERGRALGLNGVSVSLGLTLGPILGGLLTTTAGWRAIFLINLPIGILAILWARRVLPRETPGAGVTFDVRGAVLSGLSLLALLLALSEGQDLGWTSPAIVGLFAVAVGLGVAFIAVERRSAQPLIDLALFRIRQFTFGLASVIVAFAGLFTATFLLPFLLQRGEGYTPVQAGLLLAPVPIAMAIVAPFAGAASDRWGPAIPASAGMVLMVVALLSLTTLRRGFHGPGPALAPGHHGDRPRPVHEPEQQRGPGLGARAAGGHRVRCAGPDAGQRPGSRDRDVRGRGGDPAAGPPGGRCRSRRRKRGDRPCRLHPRCVRGRSRHLRRRHRDEPGPRRGWAARAARRGTGPHPLSATQGNARRRTMRPCRPCRPPPTCPDPSSPMAPWAPRSSPPACPSARRPRPGCSRRRELPPSPPSTPATSPQAPGWSSPRTFGANPIRLTGSEIEGRSDEVCRAAVAAARAGAGPDVLVAGSMGPTGGLLIPYGLLDAGEVRDAYAAQAAVMADAGIDVIWVETMMDLNEALAAVDGARAGAPGLPVVATMVFSRGRTMFGDRPAAVASALVEHGVSGLGANCGDGWAPVEEVLPELVAAAPDLHIIAKANAGIPVGTAEGTTTYPGTEAEAAAYARRVADMGATIIGGCCGTTAAHLAAIAGALA